MAHTFSALLSELNALRRYDLAQSYTVGMPHWPTHPPFLHSLTKLHGDTVLANGASSASDAIALGTHVGTHIDALCHFSLDGKLSDGANVQVLQSYADGIAAHGIDQFGLLLMRGVLLDVAGPQQQLAEDYAIDARALETAAQRAGVAIEAGDAVLVRTGWGARWNDAKSYLNGQRNPGVAVDGARWLTERGIALTGSDTVAYERIPSPTMDVHVHLLVERGVPILESLNLEALSAARVHEFVFVAAPLKLAGATASPLRPYALARA